MVSGLFFYNKQLNMRRFKLLFFCLALANALFAQPAKFMDDIYYYIENTSVFELNQEEGRTYLCRKKQFH